LARPRSRHKLLPATRLRHAAGRFPPLALSDVISPQVNYRYIRRDSDMSDISLWSRRLACHAHRAQLTAETHRAAPAHTAPRASRCSALPKICRRIHFLLPRGDGLGRSFAHDLPFVRQHLCTTNVSPLIKTIQGIFLPAENRTFIACRLLSGPRHQAACRRQNCANLEVSEARAAP
jgi:hypothetical protein